MSGGEAGFEPGIARRAAEVRQRIDAAARRAGRDPADVVLVAAAKTRTPAEVDAVVDAGVTDIGENYVQEAAAKRAEVLRPAAWRLIGPLQRNKAAAAVAAFDTIDTLADLRLAQALQKRLAESGRGPLPVLIQVRLGEEPTKSGVPPEAADELLAGLQQNGHLLCLGLMTLPPPADAEATRSHFAALRLLAARLRERSGLALPVLSMGMSGDYEVAIEEGATHVRLGTALFGPRS